MVATLVSLLNGARIVPILSIDNLIAGAAAGKPCPISEAGLVAKLSKLQWVRFYEIFPGAFFPAGPEGWGPPWGAPAAYASNIANAIEEGQRNVPNVLYNVVGTCPGANSTRKIQRPGRIGGNIEFAIASYLVVAGPGTVLSVSRGWYDRDFCWYPEFDVIYGTPTGPAVRTGPFAWSRNYTRSRRAAIDVSQVPTGKAPWPTGNGSVILLT
jgi:hypothetical protein